MMVSTSASSLVGSSHSSLRTALASTVASCMSLSIERNASACRRSISFISSVVDAICMAPGASPPYEVELATSALGQKQTYASQQAMSALHPIATEKADMCQWSCLLCPQKQTCAVHQPMSALGQ